MQKIDFKKSLASYSAKHGSLQAVIIPPMQYLMIDGHGDPNTSIEFKDAISALFPVAYKIKFASKKDMDKDYTVTPLEALWWAKDMTTFTTARDKSQWYFTVMIMQPDWINESMLRTAIAATAKKGIPESVLTKIRLETLDEGECIQTLHIGSYDEEGPVLDEMHKHIQGQGMTMRGKHHEIYLSDFRKVAPEKLKTILRQPISRS